jgi:hypothetical protein
MLDFPGLRSHGRFHLFLICSNISFAGRESIGASRFPIRRR